MNDFLGTLRLKRRTSSPPLRISPFPPLPIELVRHIMELAAQDHCTALSLTLVSKPVNVWVAPFLYRTVTLGDSEQVRAFHNRLIAQTASFSAASQVKDLFITWVSNPSMPHLTQVISTCTQLDRLVLDSLHRQPLDPNTSWPAPWEVIFVYGASSWLATGCPVLRNVTHLHLDDVLFQRTLDACKRYCPHLTHIGISYRHTNNNAVSGDNFVRLIKWLLSSTPSLKMVLLHTVNRGVGPAPQIPDFSDRVWHQLAEVADRRLLARAGVENEEHYTLLRTGRSVWDNAWTIFGNWRQLVKSI